ncbi:ABC transporter permease [Vibrio cionasavignyae]|uniref:ABC transporter permease n=1 Tax=Vibrio cionasavignyae TaxID=2910252 RepID=UPI003D10E8E3
MGGNKSDEWSDIITSDQKLIDLKLKEVWKYRDLLFMLVKRDFVSVYKQTILGPLWFFIQPILTTITFTVIFGNLAGISTDGLPHILFYLAGITFWNYFAVCLERSSTVFRDNQSVFGKVYFPRLVVPLGLAVSNLIKFSIQFGLFAAVLCYYILFTEVEIDINYVAFMFPLLVIMIAGIALGIGMIITSLTNKYRDLVFLITFGIQLLMYATPVIYPLSSVPEKMKIWLVLNPLTSIIETFKFGFLGKGTFDILYLTYSFVFMLVIVCVGTIIFNKTEKNFMDTV